MDVCVVALGKIGLPLAVRFASAGHSVVGVDIDSATVDSVNAGVPPFPGEAGLDESLRDVRSRGLFEASTDTQAAVRRSQVVVVVVPLVVDDQARPDFGPLDAATRDIAGGLQPGTLVSYETTMPVHTTRRRFGAALETLTGLKAGTDFFLCHSPERVYSGQIFADLRAYPKLVGGTDTESACRAVAFYESALEFDPRPDLPRPNGVWDLGSAEAAELAKLAETTYRDVNIGLANQFARFADHISVDIAHVIDACNTQPYSHIHRPGVAVGGHCIPVYPQFYVFNDPDATIPIAARAANQAMPAYAVELLEAAVGNLSGAEVVVLGAAYRGGVKESAFSGVFDLAKALAAKGAIVLVHDPLYTADELVSLGLTPIDSEGSIRPVGAVLQADHPEYRDLVSLGIPVGGAVIDGRNWITNVPSGTRRVTLGRGETTNAASEATGSLGNET